MKIKNNAVTIKKKNNNYEYNNTIPIRLNT